MHREAGEQRKIKAHTHIYTNIQAYGAASKMQKSDDNQNTNTYTETSNAHMYMHTHMHVRMYVYTYICMQLCDKPSRVIFLFLFSVAEFNKLNERRATYKVCIKTSINIIERVSMYKCTFEYTFHFILKTNVHIFVYVPWTLHVVKCVLCLYSLTA